MDLEQALRADVEVGVVGQAERRARLQPGRQAGPCVVDGRAGQPDQGLRVVALRSNRLHGVAAQEAVEVGDAGGVGMAPGQALQRRQPGVGQEVGQGRHADVGVVQRVEPLGGDQLAGAGQLDRQFDDAVGCCDQGRAHGVAGMGGGEQSDVEAPAVERADQAVVELGDGVLVPVLGDEADMDAAVDLGRRIGEILGQLGAGCFVQPGHGLLERPVVGAVIGQIEAGLADLGERVAQADATFGQGRDPLHHPLARLE